MRLEIISEVDISRRSFLKAMGKGAMAAAAPKQALKGLMGGVKKAAQQVIISIQPDLEYNDLTKIFNNVLKSASIAKNIGSPNIVGANLSGDAFEIFTTGNLDTIKKLIAAGKMEVAERGDTPAGEERALANFGRQLLMMTF